MALENFGLFQYLMYKRCRKNKSGPGKKYEGTQVLNTRAPKWALKFLAYFDPDLKGSNYTFISLYRKIS